MANGPNGLLSFIKTYYKEFSLGCGVGGFLSGLKLFLTTTSWTHLIGEWAIRLVFTCLIAACSGLVTAWVKDAYENYKNERKKKNKEYEQRKKASRNGRAA